MRLWDSNGNVYECRGHDDNTLCEKMYLLLHSTRVRPALKSRLRRIVCYMMKIRSTSLILNSRRQKNLKILHKFNSTRGAENYHTLYRHLKTKKMHKADWLREMLPLCHPRSVTGVFRVFLLICLAECPWQDCNSEQLESSRSHIKHTKTFAGTLAVLSLIRFFLNFPKNYSPEI